MKAVVIAKPGGPEVLQIAEVADPAPGPGEVLVRVQAAALNRADLLQRRGRYPAPDDAPENVPGLEFAGEVWKLGEQVSALRPGDRVMGIVGGGAQAELVCVHEDLCLPVPEGLDWSDAAAIPEAFLTAHDALEHRAALERGETVLVSAAGSGIGTAAVQIVRVRGATAIGLSRTAAKRRRLTELGVEHVFDPGRAGLAQAIRTAAAGRRLDVALELVGASDWPLLVESMAPGGRIVVIGLLGGSRVDLDLAWLMRRRVSIVGTVLRNRTLSEKIALTRSFATRLGPRLADGSLRAVVDGVFPLEKVAEAHARMESGGNFGKIVLRLDGDPE